MVINKAIKITKKLFNEKTNILIGNLAYLAILSLAPTIILTTSFLNLIFHYFPNLNIANFEKIYIISKTLNLTQTTNLIINLICINFLSNGINSFLTYTEKLCNFQFDNKLKKRIYSIALSIILLLIIFILFITLIFLKKIMLFNNFNFIITLLSIFLSLLIFYKFTTFQKLKILYPGALISSFALTIFTNFFYYITAHFSNIKTYYGLLTPIIIAMLLLYYSCYIIYFGILININLKKKTE